MPIARHLQARRGGKAPEIQARSWAGTMLRRIASAVATKWKKTLSRVQAIGRARFNQAIHSGYSESTAEFA